MKETRRDEGEGEDEEVTLSMIVSVSGSRTTRSVIFCRISHNLLYSSVTDLFFVPDTLALFFLSDV